MRHILHLSGCDAGRGRGDAAVSTSTEERSAHGSGSGSPATQPGPNLSLDPARCLGVCLYAFNLMVAWQRGCPDACPVGMADVGSGQVHVRQGFAQARPMVRLLRRRAFWQVVCLAVSLRASLALLRVCEDLNVKLLVLRLISHSHQLEQTCMCCRRD